MEKYKYCPHCSQPLENDGSCPGCQYGHKRQKTKSIEQPRLCAFNDQGLPCHRPGHLSTGTHGEGPWFCRTHFARIMKWPAWEAAVTDVKPLSPAVEEITRELKEPYRSRAVECQKAARGAEPMSEVDKRVNKLVPRLTGESEHAWSMRCRTWTLEQLAKRRTQAEPGELG